MLLLLCAYDSIGNFVINKARGFIVAIVRSVHCFCRQLKEMQNTLCVSQFQALISIVLRVCIVYVCVRIQFLLVWPATLYKHRTDYAKMVVATEIIPQLSHCYTATLGLNVFCV